MKASEFITKAADIVDGDRAKSYGDKTENHKNIADFWAAYLGVPITAHQAAMMMLLLKIARTKTGSDTEDNYVDIAGYAGVAGEIKFKDKKLSFADFVKIKPVPMPAVPIVPMYKPMYDGEAPLNNKMDN